MGGIELVLEPPHEMHAGDRAPEVDHLPDKLKGREYYRPSGNGEEAES